MGGEYAPDFTPGADMLMEPPTEPTPGDTSMPLSIAPDGGGVLQMAPGRDEMVTAAIEAMESAGVATAGGMHRMAIAVVDAFHERGYIAAPPDWSSLGTYLQMVDEQLQEFRDKASDAQAYEQHMRNSWAELLAEHGIAPADERALFVMMVAVRTSIDAAFEAREQGELDEESERNIVKMAMHNGMALRSLYQLTCGE